MYSFGIGIGTKNNAGEWLEVFYPLPLLNPDPELAALLFSALGSNQTDLEPSNDQLSALESALMTCGYSELAENVAHLKTSSKPIVAVLLNEDTPPSSVPQAYLKLHLLSHRLVMPQQTNITGIFGVLKNVAWTNIGAIDINELAARSLESRLAGTSIYVDCVDKFPKMVDYVVPSGVRIADTRRVRLGAYVGEGTTVMHEGFINFNAGTEGPNMVEGRISAGVFCGAGSDIGG
ncbi:MAG: 2,3,4,5-tetrahydropyridine-2,6-dicarboxylate N-succinyltransferase, partial [Porticoccaceae bacterium]|nr:2,3,4,5-tetrahydropyridine-2,6-dicarboxylate N-succinyltransferase [Porticoccaceae bacterium]